MANPYESPEEEIGTFVTDTVGEMIRDGLTKHWPTTVVEVKPVEKEGHRMWEMSVKTDPITVCEMRAFTKGFFMAWGAKD